MHYLAEFADFSVFSARHGMQEVAGSIPTGSIRHILFSVIHLRQDISVFPKSIEFLEC